MFKKEVMSELPILKTYQGIRVTARICNNKGVPLITQTSPLQNHFIGKNFDLEPKDINNPRGKDAIRVMAKSKSVLPNPSISICIIFTNSILSSFHFICAGFTFCHHIQQKACQLVLYSSEKLCFQRKKFFIMLFDLHSGGGKAILNI